GAELNPHQVDALSGTLAELMTQQQVGSEPANGSGNVAEPAPTNGAEGAETSGAEADGTREVDDDEEMAPDEEPQDWVDAPPEDDEEVVGGAPEAPGAERPFGFEPAPGPAKPAAAVGSVEAPRPGGALTPPHRRNLVDQFIGEISDRGYKERL